MIVANPVQLWFVGAVFVEVEVEDFTLLPVQVLASSSGSGELMPVADCRNLLLNLTTSNNAIFQVSTLPDASGCGVCACVCALCAWKWA